MMSVLEYASDVSLEVEVILKLCKRLGINVNSKDDILDDDSIIMLDNKIENGIYNLDNEVFDDNTMNSNDCIDNATDKKFKKNNTSNNKKKAKIRSTIL